MSRNGFFGIQRRCCTFMVLLAVCCAFLPREAAASATLFLEEPYGHLGFFTPTGHAAVYLSGVCADSPLVLRLCAPGETGIVISRYDGVKGFDWVAIPLIPYLYAVDRPEEIPLFADARMTFQLRDRYRRQHLEMVAPDTASGEAPGGNWYELIGSSYDRAIYGFEIETSQKQDAAFIRAYNASPNHSHFHLVWRNCADFARDVINFYYPKALHRSIVADVGMTTPKHLAMRMLSYSARHPELQFSRMVIPQIPGSMPRSGKVRGVVESFFRSKKYIVPTAVASPIFAGCIFVVYVGTGRHFDPASDALIYAAGGQPELPLSKEDRRGYQKQLDAWLAETNPGTSAGQARKDWERLQNRAQMEFDAQDRPVLSLFNGERVVKVGLSGDNIFKSDAPPEVVRELLEARIDSELRRASAPSVSEEVFARDWQWLLRARSVEEKELAGGLDVTTSQLPVASRSRQATGNRP